MRQETSWTRIAALYPLLTREEEYSLGLRVAQSDTDAIDLLVLHNLRLAIQIALGITTPAVELDDVISAAIEGLRVAAEKFDVSRSRFSTYASVWIKQRIFYTLAAQSTIRIPTHVSDKVRKIRRAREVLSAANPGETPSLRQVAAFTGLCPSIVLKYKQAIPKLLAIDEPVANESEMGNLGDFIGDERESTPFEHACRRDDLACLRKALQTLPKRTLLVLSLRYGIGDHRAHTLDEIGLKLHFTRERARQIAIDGERKIAQFMANLNMLKKEGMMMSQRRGTGLQWAKERRKQRRAVEQRIKISRSTKRRELRSFDKGTADRPARLTQQIMASRHHLSPIRHPRQRSWVYSSNEVPAPVGAANASA